MPGIGRVTFPALVKGKRAGNPGTQFPFFLKSWAISSRHHLPIVRFAPPVILITLAFKTIP